MAATDRIEMSISEASKRTRLPADTLRKWSERYSWARAMRHPNGYRFYTQATIAVLMRVAELLRKGWDLGSLLNNGELQLPEHKTDSELERLRAQIASLIICLQRPPHEYWTAEAMAERERAISRANGGAEHMARMERILEQNERLLRRTVECERDALAVMARAGAIEYLTQNGKYKTGDSLEAAIEALCKQHVEDFNRLTKERNDARTEVQDLYIRQAELSRRLDESLRARQQIEERVMPQLIRRLRRAERRIEELNQENDKCTSD